MDILASDPKPFRLPRLMFKSCMDKDRIEEQGLDPLLNVLKKMGGWPLLEGNNWKETEFRWFDMVYKFREAGYSVDYLVDFSVITDLKNSSWRVLDLDQPSLGMAREYLIKGLDDKSVKVNTKYFQNTLIKSSSGLLDIHERCCHATRS